MGLSDASCGAAREAKLRSVLLKTVIVLLLALCLVSPASAKYSLEEAETHITVNTSGIVHVEESVSYTFDGKYIDVHREVKALPGESIRNVEAHFSDKECELLIEPIQDGYRLIGKLPEPTPEKLTLYVSYDYYGAVKVHRDVSEISYKLWGGEWEKPLKSFKGSIMLPAKEESEIIYWTHPAAYTQEVNVENNVITLRAGEIPSTQWYEIKAVFPRIDSPDPGIVQVDNVGGLENILAIESEYQRKGLILEDLYSATISFALFVLVFPFLIYYLYGREPETDYEAISRSEMPAGSKPVMVNAIIKGRMGTPTIDGFTATIMDLVNRGYISFRNLKPEEKDPYVQESGDFMVELLNNEIYSENKGSLSELEDFEKDVLYLLKAHASEGKIAWKKLEKELQNGMDFYKFLVFWSKKVQAHIMFDKFFQTTGNTYMYWFSRLVLISAIVYYILISGFFPSSAFPLTSKINVLTASVGIYGFVMTKYSNSFVPVFGRWTPEGSLYYSHWKNFKKHLTDLPALKEHPPESIELWDSYLVYAVSLGVTKEFLQNMSRIVPPEQLKESSFHSISCNYYRPGGDSEGATSLPHPESINYGDHGDGAGGNSGGGRKGGPE